MNQTFYSDLDSYKRPKSIESVHSKMCSDYMIDSLSDFTLVTPVGGDK